MMCVAKMEPVLKLDTRMGCNTLCRPGRYVLNNACHKVSQVGLVVVRLKGGQLDETLCDVVHLVFITQHSSQ